jgi:hypothetical protein
MRMIVLICYLFLAKESAGEESSSDALTTAVSPALFLYIGQALKFGSALTVVVGIMRAVTEWTASGRKNRRIERAARLATFANSLAARETSSQVGPELSEARERAEREFIEASARCYPKTVSPSKTRRLFLMYLPPRLLAYVPHFFFFTLCALAGFAVYGEYTRTLEDSVDVGSIVVSLEIVGLICFMQRWAALEWRKCNGLVSQPKHLGRRIIWYPANSFLGLVANSMLIIGLSGLLLGPFLPGLANYQSYTDDLCVWQRILLNLGRCFLVPVAYFWSRSESMHFSGEIKSLSPSDIVRYARDFRLSEQMVGMLALFFLTIWCLILFSEVIFVSRIATYPDGNVGTIGFGMGYALAATSLVFSGIIPWIAVYRGLSDLLDHGRSAPLGVQCDRDTDSK